MRYDNIDAKEQYIRKVFASEDKALEEIFSSLRNDESHMQISPIEGKMLYTFVKMINAKKIVEIGTLAGYSAIWMARAMGDDGKLYAIEMDYKKESRIRDNFLKCNVSNKTELIIGKALDILPSIEVYAPFDLVFIDADKINYLNYLKWAEKNVRTGGLIIGDNTLLFGGVYGDNTRNMKPEAVKVMQQFNEHLANPVFYTSILIPTSEGMTVAVKK